MIGKTLRVAMAENKTQVSDRPNRWDQPFDTSMGEEDVDALLQRREFGHICAENFPDALPLRGILRNDCRIMQLAPGDLLIREGDYGNSAFYILDGDLDVVIQPALPAAMLGRSDTRKRGFLSALSQLWGNSKIPESRDRIRPTELSLSANVATVNLYQSSLASKIFTGLPAADSDQPTLDSKYQTTTLSSGDLVGEIAALGRTQRTATVFVTKSARVIEIRWQGLRDIRKYDATWKRKIDDSYREKMLKAMLASSPYFANLDESTRDRIASQVLFESYGSYEWSHSYKGNSGIGTRAEPIVAEEGHYADGALLIGAGFARVSVKQGHGYRTLSYLRAGDLFGMDELYASWKDNGENHLAHTLSALGYLHVVRIPLTVLKTYVFDSLESPPESKWSSRQVERDIADDALLEWAVEERFINGTQAMLIDQDRCVRCDDCVSACASTHDGNPRFLRHGKRHDKWLITNACMHCSDPTCMIGCPTGAIHRTARGAVVINDESCIGCATCANSCPYNNIRMVQVTDRKGNALIDRTTGLAVNKATKCDLCSTQPGGPACVRACPHDALKRIDFQTDLVS